MRLILNQDNFNGLSGLCKDLNIRVTDLYRFEPSDRIMEFLNEVVERGIKAYKEEIAMSMYLDRLMEEME